MGGLGVVGDWSAKTEDESELTPVTSTGLRSIVLSDVRVVFVVVESLGLRSKAPPKYDIKLCAGKFCGKIPEGKT